MLGLLSPFTSFFSHTLPSSILFDTSIWMFKLLCVVCYQFCFKFDLFPLIFWVEPCISPLQYSNSVLHVFLPSQSPRMSSYQLKPVLSKVFVNIAIPVAHYSKLTVFFRVDEWLRFAWTCWVPICTLLSKMGVWCLMNSWLGVCDLFPLI